MQLKSIYLLFFVLLIVSCKNDESQLIIEQQKEAQKKEVVFNDINRGWVFKISQIEPTTKYKIQNWVEWRNFLTEINQKPKSSISAFQKKATILSKKAMDLEFNIPIAFDKPQMKTRITVLITKIKSLDLYIHLQQIPAQKVVKLVGEINTDIDYLQLQMEEIVKRSQIPLEEGEQDLIMMKDTTRAIPDELK
ncbi:hypothetical protein [Flavobacterium sp.]|uniref:hypothetical protein n=1 Tax=Flavobacterium sp. TaxID=239 RepID=UPI003BEE825A